MLYVLHVFLDTSTQLLFSQYYYREQKKSSNSNSFIQTNEPYLKKKEWSDILIYPNGSIWTN